MLQILESGGLLVLVPFILRLKKQQARWWFATGGLGVVSVTSSSSVAEMVLGVAGSCRLSWWGAAAWANS